MIYTLFNPAVVTDEMREQWNDLSCCGHVTPVSVGGNRWTLVRGVDWPDSFRAEAQMKNETNMEYVQRVSTTVRSEFDSMLPDGFTLNEQQYKLVTMSEEWCND